MDRKRGRVLLFGASRNITGVYALGSSLCAWACVKRSQGRYLV